ncbi:hypothetical protein A8B82_04455 [Sulfitobacter sp. EhC04]|uniref:hypothetical protein n=1 Tax=Sulfitobacter sp. EhC04 TaxID=1849168 RepID=UPI0007F4DE50|nr:hypothetical protein [Sulfitobacter sp. EhC04]OAN71539.1 hypothetical protein A8B82_04455 [Sulfitobacter sp. EhC04]
MNIVGEFLANEAVQTAILSLLGIGLTFILNRLSGTFQAATGIRIQEKHMNALHSAILTGVEAALVDGPEAGLEVIKARAIRHVNQSVPDAIKALVPGDGVLDRLAERYYREALARIGG